MSKKLSVKMLVAEAKRKGYFESSEFPGMRFTLEEFAELQKELGKLKIPLGKPPTAEERAGPISAKQANEIILALRRGIPAQDGTVYYSVGRDQLLGQVEKDLAIVSDKNSLVRILNADVGQGKTHILYSLRECAFQNDFAVSIVTLSQNSCPLYDFMAVYHDIMWGLRTADQRNRPALSNIIDRWITTIRQRNNWARIREIVYDEIPPSLREIMAAYVDSTNLFRPNEENRQMILKYLGGDAMLVRDIRQLGISFRLSSENALQILGEMATTIRHIGFKGICILFDEAEAIHSFSRSDQRDQAFANLRKVITDSRQFPHCYFVYATTPSFFGSYGSTELVEQLGDDGLIELNSITPEERQLIGRKIAGIYATATGWQVPSEVVKGVEGLAMLRTDASIGTFVRQVVAILDERRPARE